MKRFFASRAGATAIEYSLIAAVMAAALIAGGALMSDSVNGLFQGVVIAWDNAD